MDMPVRKAIYYGFFHAVSNFNNAGFDLMGEYRSLTLYAEDPIITIIVCALIISGGIGFIVMNELFELRETRRLSLHTKVVLVTSVALTLGGMIFIFLLEFGNPKTLHPLSFHGKILAALYQSLLTRFIKR
ncbi:hypothetical protein BTO30_11860 [Domibacillus antri]|uniref:Uncharacterized protein n=1 Tax=Domibacillus antri TaxID=1714264 RepID=A0A1Q8Q3W3_9BACI|nr:hypothetical protein BTO30_11860 [Domibacillus antri]